jgi:hypothetical protein
VRIVSRPHLLAALAAPLKLLSARSRRVEDWLHLPLTDEDARLLREACAASGARFGHYYHWYLQKSLVAGAVRGLDAGKAARLLAATDRTDYAAAAAIAASDTGVLVAIPHHGHYILAMTALAHVVARHRKVLVFYGQPATHKGNEAFDNLHRMLCCDSAAGIEVIHDTRQGLARAIRALKAGEVVFIMPDAFRDEDATMMVPFCGKLTNVMLGTAVLARKTGAWILPAVATPGGHLGFRTCFGARIDHPWPHAGVASAEATKVMDYAVTRAIFAAFEKCMSGQLLYWQHVRQHLAVGATARLAGAGELETLVGAIERDPSLGAPGHVVDLRVAAR